MFTTKKKAYESPVLVGMETFIENGFATMTSPISIDDWGSDDYDLDW